MCMCETARYSHRGILPGRRICIELVELGVGIGMGLGMGMECLLGKGHMVFPERFLHVMHQMETSHSICTKRLADKAREP